VAWSSDGSKLLLVDGYVREPWKPRRLFVLNSDGTETSLGMIDDIPYPGGGWNPPDRGGSFSPDGSQVIFASRSSIYSISAQGGTPRLLHTASRRWFEVNGTRIRALLYNATYSPDGTQIAYFDGAVNGGDGIAHQLRVMNADGSGARVLVDDLEADRIYGLAWSPDGERLAFGLGSQGIYVVGADGSGLTLAIPDGAHPFWSPDGTRIAFGKLLDSPSVLEAIHGPCADPRCRVLLGALNIVTLDGMQVQEFFGTAGPWNPLAQPGQEVPDAPAASEVLELTSPLLLVVAVLALVGGVLIRRRMVPGSRDRG
jgi:Tol biopolymer transport system component